MTETCLESLLSVRAGALRSSDIDEEPSRIRVHMNFFKRSEWPSREMNLKNYVQYKLFCRGAFEDFLLAFWVVSPHHRRLHKFNTVVDLATWFFELF